MNEALFQRVENFITRDRNNEVLAVETWVPFVPGELDWDILAPAASEELGQDH